MLHVKKFEYANQFSCVYFLTANRNKNGKRSIRSLPRKLGKFKKEKYRIQTVDLPLKSQSKKQASD